MSIDRVSLLIDGSNLYHRLKELKVPELGVFDYEGFAAWLARGRRLVQQTYYIGAVREQVGNPKSREMMRGQQKFLSHLDAAGWLVRRGYILDTDGGRFIEKGVDVQLAVDLLVGAYEDAYDTAIVVSSDTDLIPAIQGVRARHKRVEYIGFSNRPSFALIRHTDERRLLVREDVDPFVGKAAGDVQASRRAA